MAYFKATLEEKDWFELMDIATEVGVTAIKDFAGKEIGTPAEVKAKQMARENPLGEERDSFKYSVNKESLIIQICQKLDA
tara:strand:+ start:859 stop:1098 length:240 start_codon:yes stop_codon:yes gene_type:complete